MTMKDSAEIVTEPSTGAASDAPSPEYGAPSPAQQDGFAARALSELDKTLDERMRPIEGDDMRFSRRFLMSLAATAMSAALVTVEWVGVLTDDLYGTVLAAAFASITLTVGLVAQRHEGRPPMPTAVESTALDTSAQQTGSVQNL